MSLIVVRKAENQLCIVSDTKLSYPDAEIKGLKNQPGEGVVKSVIVNANICISFAGEMHYAAQAITEINSDHSIDQIIECLTRYHIASAHKTEFILCYGNPNLTIYKFKNNEYGPVASAWIGDQRAFNQFQENMNGDAKTKQEKEKRPTKKQDSTFPATNKPVFSVEAMNLSMEASIPKYFSKMSAAMDQVIEDGNIDSVGGFKVNVIYKEKFYYNIYTKMYRGQFAIVGQGSHTIGHGGADEGGYSLNFFGASNDYKSLAIHLRQAKLGIVYNRENNGLLFPRLYKMDEVDFIDLVKEQYQLRAVFSTQDRAIKFIGEGRQAFAQNDFAKAKLCFDKAAECTKGKQKAEVLFFKGVTFLNLKDMPNALLVFQEAVLLDPSIQKRIAQLFFHNKTKS